MIHLINTFINIKTNSTSFNRATSSNSHLAKTKMFKLALLIFLIEAISLRPVFSMPATQNVQKLPSLNWSINNKLFNDPKNTGTNYYLKLNAHLGDSIDLVCQKASSNNTGSEYSIIYKVSSKHEFDNCIVNQNNPETVPILKCDKPNSPNSVKFTIYFVKFSPVPNALEFEEDKEYYFLSTSSGSKEGLNYMSGGLCSNFNMRFSIKINSIQSASSLVPSTSSSLASKNSGSLLTKLYPLSKNKQDSAILSHDYDYDLLASKAVGTKSNKLSNSLSGEQQETPQPQVSNLNLIVAPPSAASSSITVNFKLYLVVLLIIKVFFVCF